ncbi:hypothetical protein M8C21_012436 [Ambrosia artemisiifolia]|uniref:Helicase ATP-binding domain-containing protein n=1 Tax=Ambrosia artemisiifolia TaxID=4212 RepID=A0AAD5CUP2_AMBAR|nr:hypothetical protein M8C21_012436 [Ambrosia artemisiifolia]
MDYEQRLIAAAKYVFDGDSRAAADDDGEVNCSDYGVTAVLKPHQIEGLSWLIRRYLIGANVILGDEMGLGKTLQAISFLSYLKFCRGLHGPFLILCPLSVTDGWISEVTKFSPKLKVLRYVGDKQYRRALRREMYENVEKQSSSTNVQALPFDVLLTTYDIALIDQDFLSQIPWHYAVIDEAQRLKNPSSVLYNALREQYIMPRRLLMTGTPIQNNLTELWALMHFCMPSIFGTLEQFSSTFKEGKGALVKEKFKSLKYVLGAFMLRRTKSKLIEIGTLSLPPLTEITLMAPLVTLQKKVYMSILRKELPKLLALSSGTANQQSLQNIVIQLRKACSHPYLFAGIEPEPYEEGEHLIQASGKLIVLDQLLQKLRNSGHRVLLFAQMTHTLDILQDYMELRKYPYERLDGSVRAEERFAAIRITERTVEEVIMHRAERKLQLSHDVIGEEAIDKEGKDMVGAEAGDLKSVVLGLRMLDPTTDSNESLDQLDMSKVNSIVEKVIAFRHGGKSEVEDRTFEINSNDLLGGRSNDPILDEASYNSWVQKLKETSDNSGDLALEEANKRSKLEEKHLKAESVRKKAEEKKLAKWEAQGYTSLAVRDVVPPQDNILSDSGLVNLVYGDCTQPSKICPSEPCIIFSCVDNSGEWGHGGMFDALARLSSQIPKAYEHASEFGDLHLGDLHLIEITAGEDEENKVANVGQWVALAVVQTYNPRRKVPRSSISIPELEQCLSKASFSAAQKSGIISDDPLKSGDEAMYWVLEVS